MGYPTIVLLRHGQTEWNVEGRYQGQKDSPLTQKGREQARLNALKLKNSIVDIDRVKFYASPLGRAKNTAFIIADTLNLDRDKIIFDNNIKEFDYGIFEGELKSFCQTKYKEIFDAREADKWSYQIENGDSYEIVTQRLKIWLEEIKDEKIVIVVAHEMVNRALRGLYLNLEHKKILKLTQSNDLIILLKNNKEMAVT